MCKHKIRLNAGEGRVYARLLSEKSFCTQTGRGTPSASHLRERVRARASVSARLVWVRGTARRLGKKAVRPGVPSYLHACFILHTLYFIREAGGALVLARMLVLIRILILTPTFAHTRRAPRARARAHSDSDLHCHSYSLIPTLIEYS